MITETFPMKQIKYIILEVVGAVAVLVAVIVVVVAAATTAAVLLLLMVVVVAVIKPIIVSERVRGSTKGSKIND